MKSAPNDLEVMENYTRLVRYADHIEVEVTVVGWDGPHCPTARWEVVASTGLDEDAANKARLAALGRRRYFSVCESCERRVPCGHMHDRTRCQPCAERDLGVVY